jgi:hypothetical protein
MYTLSLQLPLTSTVSPGMALLRAIAMVPPVAQSTAIVVGRSGDVVSHTHASAASPKRISGIIS